MRKDLKDKIVGAVASVLLGLIGYGGIIYFYDIKLAVCISFIHWMINVESNFKE